MQANIIPFLLYALHLCPTRARTPMYRAMYNRPSLASGGGGFHAWLDLCRSAEAVATASNPWPLRVDSHAPASAGGARRRESWTCGGPEPSREGTQDRRSRTTGESGRPAAHLLTAPHARRARTRDANKKL